MISLSIRPMVSDDIAILAEYWYDQMALLAQKTAAIQLMPNAGDVWAQAAVLLLHDTRSFAFTAEGTAGVMGGIIGRIEANAPGLFPERIGLLRYVLVDTHTPYRQTDVVSTLLDALKEQFQTNGITQMRITAATNAPVEQAFWRGRGGQEIDSIFWMPL